MADEDTPVRRALLAKLEARLVDELHARAELPRQVALLPGVHALVLELLLLDAGQGHSGARGADQ